MNVNANQLSETTPSQPVRSLPTPSKISMVALAALIAVPSVTVASPRTFNLPEPTPTPTPAPQGPVDVRSGVQIGPRAIRTGNPAPTPTPTPAPAPRPTASPNTQPAPLPSATTSAPQPSSPASAATRVPEATSDATGSSSIATAPQSGDTSSAQGTADGATDGSTAVPSDAINAPSPSNAGTPQLPSANPAQTDGQVPVWAWIAGLVALLLGLGAFVWNRRRSSRPARLPPPRTVTEPGAPVGEVPAAALPRVDVALEIVSASRSVMMFSVEYRVTFANRTDRAVRDLSVSAQLASAERGGANAPGIAKGQQAGTIERIGPHQSRSLSGQMQIPLADIRAILQGSKPLFIPLLHLTMESAGQSPLTRSYVVGTPSAASQGRLHPIPLDTPPGGLPGLMAREISLAA